MSALALKLSEAGGPRLRSVAAGGSTARAAAPAPALVPAGEDGAMEPAPLFDALTPTLDDVVSRTWEALLAGVPAACFVCGGELERHVCRDCGSALE